MKWILNDDYLNKKWRLLNEQMRRNIEYIK